MVATGAWLETHDPGERKFIKIGFLLLENGETLPDVTIAYQTWGQLNAAKDNAILVNHAMTGWSDVPGWWPSMVGPGLPFDTDKYFVVCPNVIGGCQGSTGPSSLAPDGKRWGSRFPTVTIRDMVNAEVAFTDAMGIQKYKLAVGPSLGGMRALEWAVQLPDRVGAICTIGSSAVATGDQIGTASIQIRAIKSTFVRPGGHRRCLPEVGRRQAPRRSAGSCRTSAQRLRYRPQVDASGALAQQRVRGFGTGGASGGHVVHERNMQAVDRTVDHEGAAQVIRASGQRQL